MEGNYPRYEGERPQPPSSQTAAANTVRASILGGLIGAIAIVLTLVVVGVIDVSGHRKPAAASSTAAAAPAPAQGAAVASGGDTALKVATAPSPMPATMPVAPRPAPEAEVTTDTTAVSPYDVTTDTTATAPPDQETLVEMYGQALMKAVLRADELESAAERSLDDSRLWTGYTGSMLSNEMQRIAALRNQNVYEISSLDDVEWVSIYVSPDEMSADVRVRETWSVAYYSREDGRCISRIPQHVAPQTAHLKLVNDVWKVYDVTFDTRSPEAVAC
jgi:hypothetical protein